MGLFSRSRRTVVVVAFRGLDQRDPLRNFSPDFGYAYIWPFRERPEIGSWAVAPGNDGPATVVVGHVGMPKSATGMELNILVRPITRDEVLELAEALVTVAEQKAAMDRAEPAPAYTERVAVLHRKRRDYNSEVAVLERWVAACPRGRAEGKLAKRLVRARELAEGARG